MCLELLVAFGGELDATDDQPKRSDITAHRPAEIPVHGHGLILGQFTDGGHLGSGVVGEEAGPEITNLADPKNQ